MKGMNEMKSHIIPSVIIVAVITFAALLLVAVVAYPMHIGEPSYYHVARVDCLVAACICALVAIVLAHF